MTDNDPTFTDFVASLGHEMRSPMNGVLGFTQLLRDSGAHSETETKYLEQILFNAELEVRRITNLIDLAHVEQKALFLKSDPTPLADVIRFATESILDEASSRTVSVSIEAPDADIVADVDRMRLMQALIDLLNNAARYSSRGSTIHGHSVQRNDGYIEININNEADDPGNLAERATWRTALQRANQTDENVGLGIPHATALAEAMGGSLHLRYEDGRVHADLFVPMAA